MPYEKEEDEVNSEQIRQSRLKTENGLAKLDERMRLALA